jgi:hypothetical protein
LIDFVVDPLFQEMPTDLGEQVLEFHSVLFLQVFDFGDDLPLDLAAIDLLVFSAG